MIKHARFALRVLFLFAGGLFVFLTGCAKTPSTLPAAEATPSGMPIPATPPPALAIPMLPAASPLLSLEEVPAPSASSIIPRLTDWRQTLRIIPAGSTIVEGMRIDNSAAGNVLTVSLHQEETSAFMMGGVTLAAQDGRTGFMPIITPAKQYDMRATLALADLDNDGTDELILYCAQGATGDLHVLAYDGEAFSELLTMTGAPGGSALREVYADSLINDLHCRGFRLFAHEEGIALRIHAMMADGASTYAELRLNNGEWDTLRAFAPPTQEENRAHLRTLLGRAVDDAHTSVYRDLDGARADFLGNGRLEDLFFVHSAYGGAGNRTTLYVEAAYAASGTRMLLGAFDYDDLGGYACAVADFDGDGRGELLLSTSRGEGESERLEVTLFRVTKAGMQPLLSFHSQPPKSLQTAYAETYVTLSNLCGLPYESDTAFLRATRWAQVQPYGDGYCIAFLHMQSAHSSTTIAQSLVGMKDGAWMLLAQGKVPLPSSAANALDDEAHMEEGNLLELE